MRGFVYVEATTYVQIIVDTVRSDATVMCCELDGERIA